MAAIQRGLQWSRGSSSFDQMRELRLSPLRCIAKALPGCCLRWAQLQTTAVFRNSRPRSISHVQGGFLVNADALPFLESLKDGIASIVFLDPPFNLGKDYGRHSSLEHLGPDSYALY